MVFRSHPIGACCVRSGRLQGFIPQKLARFEEHILTLHTDRYYRGLQTVPLTQQNILWLREGQSIALRTC
jgi:hypothetical protein